MLALSRAPALRHDLRGTSRAACRGVPRNIRCSKKCAKPGLARLDLVARPGLHRDLDADEIREAGRHDDDLQAVGERRLGRLERQDVVRRRPRPLTSCYGPQQHREGGPRRGGM